MHLMIKLCMVFYVDNMLTNKTMINGDLIETITNKKGIQQTRLIVFFFLQNSTLEQQN